MAELQQLRELAAEMGLQGQDIIAFVREQQELSREERRLQREAVAAARAADAAARAADAAARAADREADDRAREHELEIIRLGGNRQHNNQDVRSNAKSPKLPCFNQKTDSMDSYINRFERCARASQWRNQDWATSLGALLTGKGLQAYSRLSEEDAVNCAELKNILLKRYNLTEEGYRKKFRQCK